MSWTCPYPWVDFNYLNCSYFFPSPSCRSVKSWWYRNTRLGWWGQISYSLFNPVKYNIWSSCSCLFSSLGKVKSLISPSSILLWHGIAMGTLFIKCYCPYHCILQCFRAFFGRFCSWEFSLFRTIRW